jgi:hypothetical protein
MYLCCVFWILVVFGGFSQYHRTLMKDLEPDSGSSVAKCWGFVSGSEHCIKKGNATVLFDNLILKECNTKTVVCTYSQMFNNKMRLSHTLFIMID